MSIHLLSIASNYTGEDCELPDCELDCNNVAEAFEPYCASAKCLLAGQSTRKNTLNGVRRFLAVLKKGDLGLLYFSGHGTTDTIGKREVQATVCHDLNVIYESEWRDVLKNRVLGTMLAMLVDCCYSEGLARGRGKGRTISMRHCFRHTVSVPAGRQKKPNAIYTACRAGEVAYSTGNGGAMTNAFLEEFAERAVNTTLQSLHRRVQKHLPNAEWPQHPVFMADSTMKKRTLKSFMESN